MYVPVTKTKFPLIFKLELFNEVLQWLIIYFIPCDYNFIAT